MGEMKNRMDRLLELWRRFSDELRKPSTQRLTVLLHDDDAPNDHPLYPLVAKAMNASTPDGEDVKRVYGGCLYTKTYRFGNIEVYEFTLMSSDRPPRRQVCIAL
ncbi:MAG: hypothetical protein QXT61_05405 [Candidatus Caldarchaeum sp.]